MNIRPIAATDAENFLALCKQVEESGFMLYEPGERTTTVEEHRIFIEQISSKKNSAIFIAKEDDRFAGFIGAMGGHVERNQHSAYLFLGVLEEYRGQGIGSALMESVFNWAKEAGISRLELTVMKKNEQAFRLYRKLGFTIEGEKVHS